MKLLNFVIIKLTTCLVLGIVIGYYFQITPLTSISLSTACLVLLFVAFLAAKKTFKKRIWFGLIGFITMVSIGVLTATLHNQKYFKDHYSHLISGPKSQSTTIVFKVKEVLKAGNYHDKYVIDILKIGDIPVSGISLLNIAKDSPSTKLSIDDILITKTAFKEINKPLNPHQFNYKSYLKKKYIYHQLSVKHMALLKVKTKSKTIFGIANNLRTYINAKLQNFNFKPEELAIINALLLGQRQDISPEVYANYTNAGAIHILAVSGLHVGIILMILNFLLKPLERFKKGRLIKTFLVVTLLWCFAIIAGLSASVVRAVTMFSIVAVAMNLKRPTNIYNTLAISMFLILLFKPLFIFDVGFQLSYLAVFSIVTIDPLLYKLWQPKNKFINFYWHTFTVSISAQLGLLPLSLFYFHQFPGLFFISNLVIIPLLGIILGLGLLIIILATLHLLPQFIASVFGDIISIMNDFISWVAHQEAFIFTNIPFGPIHLITFYILLISVIGFYLKRNYTRLRFLLIAIIAIQGSSIYLHYEKSQREFVIFHKSRNSIIGHTQNDVLYISHDLDSLQYSKSQLVTNYKTGNYIKTIKNKAFENIYNFRGKTLFVVDSLGIYNIKSIKPDYIYLRQSPKINLNRLIDSMAPKQIIADGSNYKSYMEHWKTVCKKRKLPFHQTNEAGAFIIKY